ncbi:hypothetical protein AMTR_s00015p00245760 [Amborella trichopoda]|uniref:Uncharacterized protein n=1 Tax=Amborella trichopoda TaxID=13333 RepID=W1PMJ0_AMBTC|nr:hypothetical protein AMTR_s00015p00245760 [Amborella trichopoda]
MGSPIPWVVSCKSKGLNDDAVLPNKIGGITMEGGASLNMALSSSPKKVMYPLPYRCATIKSQPPKASASFDPLIIDPLAVMVVDSDDEDPALAFED